ncbi:hypothetical protein ABZ876_37445 [Streptomyces sp. NPDC046931]|uniref:hypothetical protein n=1 Tax=Streptomyces sp. NPDC046931 TaxID=3154806 RepID=UPI0033CA437B
MGISDLIMLLTWDAAVQAGSVATPLVNPLESGDVIELIKHVMAMPLPKGSPGLSSRPPADSQLRSGTAARALNPALTAIP